MTVSKRVNAIINEYKPFIENKYHNCLESYPLNDISFVHFLLFGVWFSSRMGMSPSSMDFYALYPSFKHLPFHSFLYHIRSHNDGSVNIIDI